MENRYFVKLKLFTNIPEVADHNKTMSFMIEKRKLDLELALIKISAMSVDDFQNNLEKYKIDNNIIDNYVFDLAKSLMEEENDKI